MPIFVPSISPYVMVANTTTTFWDCNFTGTYATTSCISTNFVVTEIIVDEEDVVNHAEYFELARQRGISFRIRTAEERRLAAEAAERVRVEQERRAWLRNEAEARSRELLLSHLTADQRDTFDKNRWFVVIGGRSGQRYRIRTGTGFNGNIDVMQKGSVQSRLCCHCCSGDVPDHDQYLAQKIALMWDEDNFLRMANRHAA